MSDPPLDEAAIQARHVEIPPSSAAGGLCRKCFDTYPCDAIRLLDALAAERQAHAETRAEVGELQRIIDDATDISEEPDFPTWRSRIVASGPEQGAEP